MSIKNKGKIFLFGSITCLFATIIPLAITSCAPNVKNINSKIITAQTKNKKYSELQTSNITLENAIYGSKYNNGNYVFVYGTTSNDEFNQFLYGNGNNDQTSNNTVTEQNLSTSKFINSFFSENGLGTSTFNVSLLIYADLAPYDGNLTGLDGKEAKESPFNKYTIDDVVNIYNKNQDTPIYSKDDIKGLPIDAQLKIDTYKRADSQAIAYRNFYTYLQAIRGNGEFKQTGGIIAFKKDNDPKKFDTTENIYSEVETYFKEGK